MFVVGDPQADDEHFFRVLDRHGCLGDDGWLRADTALVSLGDHFDPPKPGPESAAAGWRILRWLAAHPASQVEILLGNHDLARVLELAPLSSDDFARALELATRIRSTRQDGRKDEAEALQQQFWAAYPTIPNPGMVDRDFSSFSEAQRALVQGLLRSGRMKLATALSVRGVETLATHAGVTTRELGLLSVDGEAPRAVADALNAFLAAAVGRVAEDWSAGRPVALDLAPLHVAGIPDEEAGGLLAHRPANAARPDTKDRRVNAQWEFDPVRPRRFDPARLPRGLHQVVGHTGHRMARFELVPWVDHGASQRERGGLRTLAVQPAQTTYRDGIHPPGEGETVLYMVDGEMGHLPVAGCELLLAVEKGNGPSADIRA